MEKLGIWKFSPEQFASQILVVLLDKIRVRWENVVQIVKDIYEQKLKELVPSLTDAKVKKALIEHKGRMFLRFNTFYIAKGN